MRGRTAALLTIPLACALIATGCSAESGGGDDELQLVTNPVAATPAESPPAGAAPAGEVLPGTQDAAVTALAVHADGATLAVGVADPPAVRLYALDDLSAPPRDVPLPGPAEDLVAEDGDLVAAMPGAGELARIGVPDGQVGTVAVQGQPSATARSGAQTLVAVRDRQAIDVLDGDQVTKSVTGQINSADDVLVAGGHTVVLDRIRSALFDVDLAADTVQEGLRAGDGATNAVVDAHGRVLVADTRGGALLAFSTDPLLLRQRYPVPGAPYGIAYDAERDLAWVTLTESNEVVGYDVGGGEPVERFRFPTVRQPDTVAVDAHGSRVIVGSSTGEGIQVITT